jgi:hypothetical protein
MGGFDTLALGSKILFGDNWFSDFNAALHESSIYNVAQTTIASVAVFTGGMNSGFNKAANSAGVKPSCFVAGTLVMAVAGMVAIETIKSGDKVISTDPETMETGEKTVLETYIREVTTLVHITVNGEEIITTVDHPFYVQGRGFVEAGKLLVGDKFLNVNGNILLVENFNVELTDEPVTVYNFQIEDFHTYHVGENGVWVHNANCKLIKNDDGTYDAELSYKEDWTPEQRAEADAKCKALSDADTVKTKVERNDSPSVEYKKAFGKDSIPAGKDIDHTIDLQLGENPDVKVNGKPLDKSVNRSLGKQIGYLIKDFDYGTIIRKFTMVNRQ